MNRTSNTTEQNVRVIAFYLPQYHPIPENDKWWGKGFTEWNNVVSAKPLVNGHYQPHLPADLGFYDLRLPEIRQAQADLAGEYGIHGFCYYHYWFNGRTILDRPFREVLTSGSPDFPFCICWANENWTRIWDGGSNHVLLEQHYSAEDDRKHIEHLLPVLADRRYIRIGGRPLLLVYRTELLPDIRSTVDVWRNAAIKAGIGDLFLARVESLNWGLDPAGIGFDAAIEFAPDWRVLHRIHYGLLKKLLTKTGLFSDVYSKHQFADYNDLVRDMLRKDLPDFRFYRCVTPGWDNSARRKTGATIFLNSTPAAYGKWLKKTLLMEKQSQKPSDEKIVFVNAWNEWAEGNHLEPDQRWGNAYLDANKRALDESILSQHH